MSLLISIMALASVIAAYASGLRDGRRTFQIELRQALHRGEDVAAFIEAPGGPSDYA